METRNIEDLLPQELVQELDRYIVGQQAAKKTVAIALRNRIRRSKLDPELQCEITPKNIIMIGSTGVGKTEIARRLSQLSGAPFLKVEATKYTEVGYVGRDVESMIRDLMASALTMVHKELQAGVDEEAARNAEEMLLDLLLPRKPEDTVPAPDSPEFKTREKFRSQLHAGELEDRIVELPARSSEGPSSVEIFAHMPEELGNFNLGENLQDAISGLIGNSKNHKPRKLSLKKAREILHQEQKEKLVDEDAAVELARERVQNQGIIFIDEIDKIAVREGRSGGAEISREGVQRDILPIVEGSQVRTRYGMIDTTHILFIAAGAFTLSKPSDLIPELQGRFPLRVELESLTAESLEAILSTPKNSLIFQYTKLLETEELQLEFSPAALKRLASIAAEVNANTEDIGARRLHTVLETLLEEVSFHASNYRGQKIKIDEAYVDKKLQGIAKSQDLSRYIL